MPRLLIPGSRVRYAEGGGPDTRCYRVKCDRFPALVPAYKPAWTVRQPLAAHSRVGGGEKSLCQS